MPLTKEWPTVRAFIIKVRPARVLNEGGGGVIGEANQIGRI